MIAWKGGHFYKQQSLKGRSHFKCGVLRQRARTNADYRSSVSLNLLRGSSVDLRRR
jgi:hypothetical protein